MRTWCLSLALVVTLGLGLIAVLPTPAADNATAERIAKLVEQLGSGSFDEREQATRLLDQIGTPALIALRKAAQSGDPEVKRRAEDLVQKIQNRGENTKLLEPKRVHLVYKDTPVPEAVADFAKKSGYNVVLLDPLKKLADRKVTLDTGDTTFWQAFDQFCEKAGLVEATANVAPRPGRPGRPVPLPLPAQPGQGGQPGANNGAGAVQVQGVVVAAQAAQAAPAVQIIQGQPGQPGQAGGQAQGGQGGAAPAIAPVPGPGVATTPNQITLVDGKPQELPTAYSGAVRIRALQVAVGAAPRRGAEEVNLILQISPEPKIQWQNLLKVDVKKAVDDQGKELQVMADERPADPNTPVANAGLAFVARPPIFGQGLHQQVPVRLKKGGADAKMLKELEGVISAQVWGAPQAMINVDNVFKAAGNTVKGNDGGFIKVNDVTRDAKGQVVVKLEMEMPPNVLPVGGQYGGIGTLPGGPIQILPIQIQPVPPAPQKEQPQAPNGLQFQQVQQAQPAQVQVQVQIAPAIDIAPFGGGAAGLTLEDEKGQQIQPTQVRQQVKQNGNAVAIEHVLTFPAQKGDSAKLVFSASKSATLEIPFKLKNVPLP